MHISHSIFAGAIERKLKLRITFFSKEDRQFLTRVCAPMDYGPSRRAKDQRDRYHMWDYDSDSGKPHPLAKFPGDHRDRVDGRRL
jgi:hypothetical protein